MIYPLAYTHEEWHATNHLTAEECSTCQHVNHVVTDDEQTMWIALADVAGYDWTEVAQ